MTIRLYFLALLLAAPACSDDSDPNDSTSSSTSGAPTTGGSSTGEIIGWGGVCYVDLQCGDGGTSSCVHPDGCDKPGECSNDDPQGECPDDPAPKIPMPHSADGTATLCKSDATCMIAGEKFCFFYDGKCGEGFRGICLTKQECIDAVPSDLTESCPGLGFECDSPMYDP